MHAIACMHAASLQSLVRIFESPSYIHTYVRAMYVCYTLTVTYGIIIATYVTMYVHVYASPTVPSKRAYELLDKVLLACVFIAVFYFYKLLLGPCCQTS